MIGGTGADRGKAGALGSKRRAGDEGAESAAGDRESICVFAIRGHGGKIGSRRDGGKAVCETGRGAGGAVDFDFGAGVAYSQSLLTPSCTSLSPAKIALPLRCSSTSPGCVDWPGSGM